MNMMRKIILAFMAVTLSASVVHAQPQSGAKGNRARIEGVIVEASNNKAPVSFAVIRLLPQDVYVSADENGHFQFKNVEAGKVELQISFIGMEQIDTSFNVVASKDYSLKFAMKEANFRLEEVTVLATQSKAGSSTASNISRQAMDHLQTSSLKDVMQLLPGVSIANPDISKANTISIRTLSDKSDGNANLNSLGTSIVVDGAPLSNNANMQALTTNGAVIGGSSPVSGVDLRSLSTDNIESIEVIRGIPSAEYGDLTSGMVILRSKAGKEPLTVRFKTNPYTYQVSASKGVDLGGKRGSLNISGDYAYNTTRQYEAYLYYQRFNLKALYSKTFNGNFNTNTSLDLIYGIDTRDKNPDDLTSQLVTGAKDIGFRFNSNGSLNTPNAWWLKNIRYSLMLSYTNKQSYREQMLSNASGEYSWAMTDGTLLSNRPNQDIYDVSGNKITNIPSGEMNSQAMFLPNEYFSRYDIYGKELNFFGKISANLNKRWKDVNNRILIGLDYKLDGNKGKGIVYDINTPPKSASASASRPRPFKDIPFMNQLGVFLEDYFTWSLGERTLNIMAGARLDYFNGKMAVSPRINASFEVFPKLFTLRGGYGVNTKAPTAMYLYPQNAYFDYVNCNDLGNINIPEGERLYMVSTRVFNRENPDLKVAQNTKTEIGFDLKIRKIKLSVTGYQDKLKNGYNMGQDFGCFNLIPYDTYKVAEQTPGGIPKLELLQKQMIFAIYSKPMNTIETVNKGLEYEVDFGRIQRIRTSFYLNGAWMSTRTRDMSYSYSTAASPDNKLERNIGVYEQGKETICQEKINTTFRITHNIPKIGFVITLTAQVDWKNKLWTEYGNDTMFEKYISRLDGKVYDFNPAMENDPEFKYLFPSLKDNRFIVETYQPTVIFNFMLSKEIGNFLTASFFVNNMFNSRPLYQSKTNPGSFTELGIPTFFGFDLKINIK